MAYYCDLIKTEQKSIEMVLKNFVWIYKWLLSISFVKLIRTVAVDAMNDAQHKADIL